MKNTVPTSQRLISRRIIWDACSFWAGYNFLQDDTVYHYEQITVHTGDTMWAIADRWADQDEDVREVIYRICETNALANTNLKPGQKLLVPVRMQFVDQLMVAEAGDIKG